MELTTEDKARLNGNVNKLNLQYNIFDLIDLIKSIKLTKGMLNDNVDCLFYNPMNDPNPIEFKFSLQGEGKMKEVPVGNLTSFKKINNKSYYAEAFAIFLLYYYYNKLEIKKSIFINIQDITRWAQANITNISATRIYINESQGMLYTGVYPDIKITIFDRDNNKKEITFVKAEGVLTVEETINGQPIKCTVTIADVETNVVRGKLEKFGEKYDGEWEDGIFKKGTKTIGAGINPTIYEGNFNDKGVIVGKGKIQYPNGKIFEGEFDAKNNLIGKDEKTAQFYFKDGIYDGNAQTSREKGGFIKHGQGTMKYNNGDIYVGSWYNDKRDTRDKMDTRDKNGKLVTIGKMTFNSGANAGRVYEGKWEEDNISGNGTLTDENGIIYTGEFDSKSSNVFSRIEVNGEVFNISPNITKFEGQIYILGKTTLGWCKITYSNGNSYNGPTVNNKRQGGSESKIPYRNVGGDSYLGYESNIGTMTYASTATQEDFAGVSIVGYNLAEMQILKCRWEDDKPLLTGNGRVDIKYFNGDYNKGIIDNGIKSGIGSIRTREDNSSPVLYEGWWNDEGKLQGFAIKTLGNSYETFDGPKIFEGDEGVKSAVFVSDDGKTIRDYASSIGESITRGYYKFFDLPTFDQKEKIKKLGKAENRDRLLYRIWHGPIRNGLPTGKGVIIQGQTKQAIFEMQTNYLSYKNRKDFGYVAKAEIKYDLDFANYRYKKGPLEPLIIVELGDFAENKNPNEKELMEELQVAKAAEYIKNDFEGVITKVILDEAIKESKSLLGKRTINYSSRFINSGRGTGYSSGTGTGYTGFGSPISTIDLTGLANIFSGGK
jgi:hypothetical protein